MKQDETRRPVWPRVLGYFLAVMVLLTLLSRAADSIMLPSVRCERPLPGALTHTVALSGVIEAQEQWPVMAEPELTVARVNVRTGQAVKAGDVLLSYDAEALQRTLAGKQAELKKITLQGELDALDQQPSGGDDDENSKKTVNMDKIAIQQQLHRLELDAAQDAVDRIAQLLYGGAVLTAPVDGTVSEVLVKPGDTASGAALRLFPDSSGHIVRASVTQEQTEHLLPGMEVRVRLPGAARDSHTATLSELAPSASGYEAVFSLPQGVGAIGQTVSITAIQNTETYSVRVPIGAIAERSGMAGVYRIRTGDSVLGEVEYAEFVNVTVIETDAQYAAIEGPLLNTDQVIVSSSKPFSEGDRVRSTS